MTDNDDGGVMPLAGRLLGLLAAAAFWPDDAIGPRLAQALVQLPGVAGAVLAAADAPAQGGAHRNFPLAAGTSRHGVLSLHVTDARAFAASEALLPAFCTALAQLVGDRLDWPHGELESLTRAALSMNLALGPLQDRLVQQREGLSADQQRQLAGHGDRAADLLQRLGAHDAHWLTAVRLHHDAAPGPLAGRAVGERLARLLMRIDQFAARLSPRIARRAQAGAQAARAIFLDEQRQQDEAGAALIKAVGLYPPGTFVRLANGEEGMVVKRGTAATEPLVAALLGKSGNPLTEPVPRDTRLPSQAVAQGLAPHELRLRLSIEKLLRLAAA